MTMVEVGAVLNLRYHWKRIPLPAGFMFAHAGIAVLGFVLVLVSVLTPPD